MSVIGNNILAGASGAVSYDIDQSLRFEDGDSAYLSRTAGTATSNDIGTFSFWAKGDSGDGSIFSNYSDANNRAYFKFDGSMFQMYGKISGSTNVELETTQLFRDPAAWYHFVVAVDVTQVTAADRVKIYVNGSQITAFATSTYPAQDTDFPLLSKTNMTVGTRYSTSLGDYYDGYLAEVHFIDGTALDASSFGKTDAATNQWKPINVTGLTYGTNGFYQKYSSTELANSFTDSADHSIHTITPSGDVHTDTTIKKIGTASAQFDGTGDYLTVPASSDWATSGAWTFEFWVYFNALPAGNPGLINWYANNGNTDKFAMVVDDAGDGIDVFTNTGWSMNSGTSSITTSTWYHFAVTFDGSSAVRLYQDGVQKDSTTLSSLRTDGDFTFGNWSGSGFLNGYMDEIRISNTVRYPDGTTFTPSTTEFTADKYTKLLLHCDGSDSGTTFTDSSWTGAPRHYITANGDVTNTRAELYTTEAFTSTDTWTCPSGVTSIEYLLVGGGGSGGGEHGGGGGAGELKTSTSLTVTPGTVYTMTVGTGGTGVSGNTVGNDGAVSTITGSGFSTISSAGGGGGGTTGTKPGRTGGSGGGGSRGGSGGASTAADGGFGNAGGSGSNGSPDYGGGGGGGAGGAGGNGDGSYAGTAGIGKLAFDGYYYGGGGGASTHTGSAAGSAGGSGGGGGGAADTGTDGAGGTGGRNNGSAATGYAGGAAGANTGSGGGAGSGNGGSTGGAGGSGVVVIKYIQPTPGTSSIKFDGTGDYLSLTSSAGNDLIGGSGSWTIEGWVRWTSGSSIFMEQGDSVTRALQFWIQPDGDIQIYLSNTDGSWDFNNISGSTLTADTWTHLALVKNSSAITLYKDGVTDSVIDGSTTQTSINNSSGTFYIGSYNAASSFWNGYMDEIRISDSARYTTTFTPSTTAFVADANTKLLIHSDFNGGLGADSSGNKNDFDISNIVATDQMIDTPTNNYCTLNPLDVTSTGGTYSEGNLKFAQTSGATGRGVSTFRPDSGKWYGEFYVVDATRFSCGVMNKNNQNSMQGGGSTDSAIFFYNRDAYYNSSTISNYLTSALVNGDIISFALDLDNTILWYGINGTWQQSATVGEIEAGTSTNSFTTFISSTNPISSDVGIFIEDNSSGGSMSGVANFGQDSSFAGAVTAQGNGGDGEDFYYTPPAGFKALNSDNLPDPSIALPTDHFNSILYTGNGGTQSLTGVGFAPDFFWNKNRTGTYQHMLYNTISGATKYLSSGETDAEATDVNSLTSFDSDGVTLGSAGSSNATGVTSVAWNWKAGGAASSITAGSIDGTNPTIASSVSANTTAGFSIVSYTGTGSAATISHGLSQAPDMVICKERSAVQQWINYQSPLGATKYLHLNGTDAAVTNSTVWNDTEPTASVFSVGTAVNCNESSGTYIAYCFHSIEGYSKVGSYVGNGVVDGTFVYLGFKPAFLFWKQSSAARDWAIIDNSRSVYNDQAQSLFPNDSAAEYDGAAYGIDLVSNGFKWRSSNSTTNISSGTYIYYAIAESPFKTSNAR